MNKKVYIFGAHPRGYTLFQYLRTLYPEREILGFLFNNQESNPQEIEGVRVYNLNRIENNAIDKTASVYVATRGMSHDAIIEALISLGFSLDSIIPVTPEIDMELRNLYVARTFMEEGRKFIKMAPENGGLNTTKGSSNATIFVAKTVFDKGFSVEVGLKEYEVLVQAGTAIAGKRLTDALFFDDQDDNISDRNQQFCELTALYWIWKHSDKNIIGLEHWRRRFLLPENWVSRMDEEQIDVILPVPLCVMPSLEENYRSRHEERIWNRMLEILREIHPEDADGAREYFKKNNLFSPCNMIIARRNVLEEYCKWLFPVLLRLADEIGTLEDSYQNRYPGFISERLLNYFFAQKRDKWRIIYADKSFLS